MISEVMKNNCTLTELYLSCGENNNNQEGKRIMIYAVNNLGDEGARMISEVMKSNSTLTVLTLWSEERTKRRKKTKKVKREE